MGRRADDYEEVPGIVAHSAAMREAVQVTARFAGQQAPILIWGPTGTGKEVLARHAHVMSGRRGPFVDVNCGALPREMVEALMFGSRRGSFTSSVQDLTGLFEQAAQGTLYLDELCSMPLEGQAKLLRVLESGDVRRLGDDRARRIDALVVASVQENPLTLIKARRLRSDLYYRIGIGLVSLPPLSERPADIVPLAQCFAARHGFGLSLQACSVLRRYEWPGNVRELNSVITRAAATARSSVLRSREIRDSLGKGAIRPPGSGAQEAEASRLLEACIAHGWDMRRVASALDMSRATAYRRARQLGLSRPRAVP
jgi:transcriptional regulator with PAS, ATPase and Fis domain